MKTIEKGLKLLAATLSISMVLAGCSVSEEGEPIYVDDLNIFPDGGFSDWITYADQISVVEVVKQKRMRPETGFGMTTVGRVLTLKVVESVWTRDGGAVDTLEIIANGWIEKAGKLRPVVSVHGERMTVGQRYLMPLVNNSGRWGKLADSAVIPIDGNRVTYATQSHGNQAATRRYAHMSVSSIANAISTANPDALSWQVDQTLSPVQRAIAIGKLRDSISGNAERMERDGERQ